MNLKHYAAIVAGAIFTLAAARAETISIVIPTNATPRVEFGAQKLVAALNAVRLDALIVRSEPNRGRKIYLNQAHDTRLGREGFRLDVMGYNDEVIQSGDDSGALYGCLELAKRIRHSGTLPVVINFQDKPAMKLRGTCIGMQKTYILPGRHVYEYPYTPELFPFFYDKEFWQEYLDFLVRNRMNTLYLWNGHPFASLVKLKDYPFAVEVPDDVFQKNVAMFHWITKECDKRGIWLVQMFYSLLVSKPFAEHYGISTQLSSPTPEALDYTRKSIAEFVKQYPHVGLLVCLGEALRGIDNQKRFLTETIIPGVKDGMQEAGLTEEPPLVVRAHATDPAVVMPAAVEVYSNIYTMAKYNGESLTTWQPRGLWQQRHLAMSRLTSHHVANVHILANLEPFRYGAQRFIQKCVQAARDRLGATGIHLYPLFYWNWPNSPDIAAPPLKQWRRDWIWFEAWARYEWHPDIPQDQDRAYWIDRIAQHYGTEEAAEKILDAYNDAGECAPRLLRRFGITEGNRQTLSLGMTLDELVNPDKYNPYDELWKSQSPPGERLQGYVEKEWNHEPHVGETPPQVIREVLGFSQRAVEEIDAAAPFVTEDKVEFGRLRNDVHCIRQMSQFYAAKAEAARLVLRYNFSKDISDMEKAERYLAESLDHYQKLAELAGKAYEAANSMQTSQRKIPFPGGAHGVRTNYLWSQIVPRYQKELVDFHVRVTHLKNAPPQPSVSEARARVAAWPPANFTLVSTNAETYEVKVGARPFMDRGYTITKLAPQLRGLTGMRFSHEAAKNGRYKPIEFEVAEPVRVLVGYFNNPRNIWLQVPKLEFAAQADERGGIETVIEDAAEIQSCPSVNLHAFRYGPGRHKLELIGKGSFVVLGVIPQSVKLEN